MLDDGSADAIDENLIGPGYIADSGAHPLGDGTEPGGLAHRAHAAVLRPGGRGLPRARARRSCGATSSAPPSVSLPAQFSSSRSSSSPARGTGRTSPGASSTRRSSRSLFYVLRLVPRRLALRSPPRLQVLVLAMLALTRSFEFMARRRWRGGSSSVCSAILGSAGQSSVAAGRLAVGAARVRGDFAAVYGITGKRNSFLLYGSDAASTATSCPRRSPRSPTFDLALVPIKLAQIFLDPCFYSLCELDYRRTRGTAVPRERGGILDSRSPCSSPRSSCCRCASSRSPFSSCGPCGARERALGPGRELRFLVELDGRRPRA